MSTVTRLMNSLVTRSARRSVRRTKRLRLDALETREVPASTWSLDFNTNTSPTASGFTGVKPLSYSVMAGHGWADVSQVFAVSRTYTNPLLRDFHYGTDATFQADVPNGEYEVIVGLGDASLIRDHVSIWGEGQPLAADVTTKAKQFMEVRGRVTVADGQFSLRIADAGGLTPRFAINKLKLTPVDPNAPRLWSADQTPAVANSSQTKAVELGLRFESDVAGYISGIRFFKGINNKGTHTGSLWAADGTRLATATFVNETASGWQQVYFSSPVPIQANTTYIASYFAPKGRYSVDNNYFTLSGAASGQLNVRSTAQGGGGTFIVGGGFPTQTSNDSNYWVDVIFARETDPPVVLSVTPVNGATNVPTSTPVSIVFNEGMEPTTLTPAAIALRTAAGATVSTTLSYNPATFTVTLTPTTALSGSSTYSVFIDGGADATAVRDLAGNPLAADFSSTFTTATVGGNGPTANAGTNKTANEASAVSFTGSATGGVGALTYHWDFGDGGTADGTLTPSHTYVDNGTYTVTLTVTDSLNQADSDTATVTVNNVNPTATLTNNGPVNVNTTVTITFSNQDDVSTPDKNAGFTYSYDFNNDGSWDVTDSTNASATTTFSSAGSKIVRGRIKDKDGGTTVYTTTVTVTGPVTADAGANKAANEGASVSFTGASTGGTNPKSYHWEFGDGATADGTLTPSHSFADNGTYTVTLTVTDANNNTASDTATVTINNVAPTATLSNNGPVNINANVTISFSNQDDISAPDRNVGFTYSYDFNNDGSWDIADSSNASATTTFSTSGAKTVRGRIMDKDGGNTIYTTTVNVNSDTTGLVAAFGFDEGTGTSANSTIGGHVGTISGAAWVTTGRFGNALTFDGTNDWVTVADANSLDLTNGMTLEAWVNPSALNGWETVMLKESGSDLAYALYADNNGNDQGDPRRPTVSIRQGGTTYDTQGTAQLALNQWSHLAATYDGSVLRMYVNGSLATSLNRSGSNNTSANPLRIGGNNVWSEWFNGMIDEIRVYNRALSLAEIQTDMNTPVSQDTTPPTVTSVTPANNATNVNSASTVKVVFSEAMDSASITTSTFVLKTAAGATVTATVSYDSATKTATLTPSANLTASATYSVLVEGGSGAAVKDLAGNALAADFNSTFTVSSGGPPVANAGADKTASEGSSVSFTGTASDGNGTLTYSWTFGDGGSANGTLTPSHTYTDNGTYTVTLTVTDSANQTDTDTAVVTVTNANPTATFSNNGPVLINTNVTISFTNQADPSSVDHAAGYKYSYDLDNNGGWDILDSTSASTSTQFSTPGAKVIRGRILDKDGGSTIYTTTVQVDDPTQGPTYYVATNGNDNSNGSSGSPWRTLQKAADSVAPGDTVVVRAGTYVGFQIFTDGTATQRITFKADPGVLVNAKLGSASAFSGAINLEGADYITIDGFEVKMATLHSVRTNIRSVENTGAIIKNNRIDDASWWGILTGNSANLLVENNFITDTINQHGIYIANSADNPTVRGNRVENSRGAGIQINADKDLPGDGIISNALVERNILLNNCAGESSSLNLNGVEDSRIINNLIASQYRNGIAMYQDNQTAGTKRNYLAFNTIIGSAYYGISISGTGSIDNKLFNNILFSQGWGSNYRGGLGVENLSGLQSDYNVLMGKVNRDPSDTEQPAETPTQWRNRGFDTHSIFLEEQYGSATSALSALFVTPPAWPLYSPETGDYHLKAGSPAINAGLHQSTVTTDIDGDTRGNPPDIGAYES